MTGIERNQVPISFLRLAGGRSDICRRFLALRPCKDFAASMPPLGRVGQEKDGCLHAKVAGDTKCHPQAWNAVETSG
jgi:hypothetical protein